MTLTKLIAINLSVYAFGLALAALLMAGEGYESILRRNMERADPPLTEAQIDTAMTLPQEMTDIMIADRENPMIPPVEFIYFAYDGRSAIIFTIRDTIWGRVLYDLDAKTQGIRK